MRPWSEIRLWSAALFCGIPKFVIQVNYQTQDDQCMDAATTGTVSGNLIHHQHVVPTTPRPKITIGPKSNQAAADVRLNKNGETIESIEIVCACGEKILIKCEYA